MLLDGMHIPLTTPFFPEGRLHLRKLEQNVARYSLTPAAGLLVLGATGEAGMLSDEETREVLAAAIAAASPSKVMLAGVSRDSVRGTLSLCEQAATLGYDAVCVRQPSIAGLRAKECRLYFEAVADHSALPIVLAGDLPVDLAAALASHPRILGWMHDFARQGDVRWLLQQTTEVKRTVTVTMVFAAVTGRMAVERDEAFVSAASLSGGVGVLTAPPKPAIKTRTKMVGFQLIPSGTERMLDALEAGAVGVAPALAAAAPQACHEVLAAWKDGDPPLAAEKQLRLVEVARLVEVGLGVAGVKYGCDLNGYFGGSPRLPLLSLTGEERARAEKTMAGLAS